MTDILDEIEQDLRKDRWRKLWEKWGTAIVALAAIVVLAIAGWRGSVAWQASRAAALGDRYILATQAARDGRHDDAIREFEALIRDGSGGYPALSRFQLAAERAAKGANDAAVRDFDALAADRSIAESWRDIARLRAGLLLVEQSKATEAATRLEPLAVAGNPFRNVARELLGVGFFKQGDLAAAARWFGALQSDPEASQGARLRANLALDLLAGEGVTP